MAPPTPNRIFEVRLIIAPVTRHHTTLPAEAPVPFLRTKGLPCAARSARRADRCPHQRLVGRRVRALRQINAGRRHRRARDAENEDVGFVEVTRQISVVEKSVRRSGGSSRHRAPAGRRRWASAARYNATVGRLRTILRPFSHSAIDQAHRTASASVLRPCSGAARVVAQCHDALRGALGLDKSACQLPAIGSLARRAQNEAQNRMRGHYLRRGMTYENCDASLLSGVCSLLAF